GSPAPSTADRTRQSVSRPRTRLSSRSRASRAGPAAASATTTGPGPARCRGTSATWNNPFPAPFRLRSPPLFLLPLDGELVQLARGRVIRPQEHPVGADDLHPRGELQRTGFRGRLGAVIAVFAEGQVARGGQDHLGKQGPVVLDVHGLDLQLAEVEAAAIRR